MIVIEEEKVRHMLESMFRTERAVKDIEWNDAIEETMNQFINLPTIDAVPVVRCKDCMKYDSHGHRCKHWNHGVVVMDFCSRAERRTDEGQTTTGNGNN